MLEEPPKPTLITCSICFDEVPISSALSTLCGHEGCLSSSQHACKACLKQHFEGIVSSGFEGACPPITCAFHPKRVVSVHVWRGLVDAAVFHVVQKRAQATLSLQCSGCHSRKDQSIVPQHKLKEPVSTAEERATFDAARVAPLLKLAGKAPTQDFSLLAAFQTSRAAYLGGCLDAPSFVAKLDSDLLAMPFTKSGANGVPCSSFVAVLHSLGEDPERVASLHGAYLRKFPDCHSTCCKVRHCFRCHIKGFHDGQSCESYQASKATVEDVVPCPKCGLQLTKGDGCSSVNCVCGQGFNWATELGKVHLALSNAFESEAGAAFQGAAAAENIANLAALVAYNAAPPQQTDHGSAGSSVGVGKTTVLPVTSFCANSFLGIETTSAAAAAAAVDGVVNSHDGAVVGAAVSGGGHAAALMRSDARSDAGSALHASAWANLHLGCMAPARGRLFEAIATGGGIPLMVERQRCLAAAAFALTQPPSAAAASSSSSVCKGRGPCESLERRECKQRMASGRVRGADETVPGQYVGGDALLWRHEEERQWTHFCSACSAARRSGGGSDDDDDDDECAFSQRGSVSAGLGQNLRRLTRWKHAETTRCGRGRGR